MNRLAESSRAGVIRSGAQGVAVVSAIASADDSRQAARKLVEAVMEAKGKWA